MDIIILAEPIVQALCYHSEFNVRKNTLIWRIYGLLTYFIKFDENLKTLFSEI